MQSQRIWLRNQRRYVSVRVVRQRSEATLHDVSDTWHNGGPVATILVQLACQMARVA
jgi:hypothetical protein